MAKQENDKKNSKHFWKDFRAELKKVIWPTKKQLTNNTLVVIAMVIITAVIVLVLDLAFEGLNTYGINALKQTVQSSISTTADENTESQDDSVAEEDNASDEVENSEETSENSEEATATESNEEVTE